MNTYPKPPFPPQAQPVPGSQAQMRPQPDCGEQSYVGSGRLANKVALITGADSGIGRAVAIAFAREGADVAIAYLNEHEDARETARWVEQAGRQCLLLPGDLAQKAVCDSVVERTVAQFGRIDVLVNNAAYQMTHDEIEDISDSEWCKTFDINITAIFRLCKAALAHMAAGSSIINTSSINSDMPRPTLLAYATTKGAIANFSAGLAQLLGKRGIRVNSVAPGPIWTPLIVSTMPEDHVSHFGEQTPLGRPGQPVEVAPLYVLLASDEASYLSGCRYGVTGGKPIL
ncbi:SDR family oxidoreductase [Pseudomonas chlororaphis]|uniref:SDR family oxidoreductase n=1 Tax=Pseudomonas chlororaphis TaxID=587753 RepID=UPI000F557383|nr:SDR family oxidoreductase [Pseudomonas chlororaphis]AZD22449.1 Oxidoreductase, short-chain dehydrogenase/reductase family [Pseudomonas chlororaphis subsp. aurantiaca]AZD48651.1 Oxidoreductase, short-chain dehydrogenase/reductase family [Pseudomonas chlororaphis subsp. aurantiaca]AZD61105.1 Oxidoreductase, short-chain dehydrogenase/reductase family [Pseudomonas chlororaphis subsp. aurantiaca]AZD73559.1 Oxidoreductase, short-chain dehydrogenase/reductase family [Pseudomonas chlororaphis subsp.